MGFRAPGASARHEAVAAPHLSRTTPDFFRTPIGMFFTRKPAAAARITEPSPSESPPSSRVGRTTAAESPVSGAEGAELNAVLDALGGVLQAYGRYTLDTDTATAESSRGEVTAWTRHATIGAPHPMNGGGSGAGVGARDWRGLVRFVGEHRRGERQYVVKAMRDLRETIWAFVACAHQVTKLEEESGRSATAQLERVKAAVESNETAAIRREAIAAVEVVGELLERRRAEQRRQFTALAERLRELGRELEEARREVTLDPLTQLANRKGLEEAMARSVALHALAGQPASLLMIDVDRFKATNDTYGHAVGDAALRLIADCLTRVFKRGCDLVCRYGGDEFAVLLYETTGAKAAELGERLREAVREARLPGRAAELTLDVSVGVAELAPSDTAESWAHRADEALYAVKKRRAARIAEQ